MHTHADALGVARPVGTGTSAGARVAALMVLLLVTTMLSLLGASQAEAAVMSVSPYEKTVVNQANVARSGKGLRPLKANPAMARCHVKRATRAANQMSRTGRFAATSVKAAYGDCPSVALAHTGVRSKTAKAAARQIMKRKAVRRAVLAQRARTMSIATRRNNDGTWSTVVVVGGPKKKAAADTSEAGLMRSAIYADTNKERAAQGLPKLGSHACLQANAQRWAEQLAKAGKLAHQDLKTVWDDCGTSSWVGENVAYRFDSQGSAMVVQWMNSPGHKANILNKAPVLIGVGVAPDGNGRWYGVQVFSGKFW